MRCQDDLEVCTTCGLKGQNVSYTCRCETCLRDSFCRHCSRQYQIGFFNGICNNCKCYAKGCFEPMISCARHQHLTCLHDGKRYRRLACIVHSSRDKNEKIKLLCHYDNTCIFKTRPYEQYCHKHHCRVAGCEERVIDLSLRLCQGHCCYRCSKVSKDKTQLCHWHTCDKYGCTRETLNNFAFCQDHKCIDSVCRKMRQDLDGRQSMFCKIHQQYAGQKYDM